MQPAITPSSVGLGVGALKVLRCSSPRSDPADAGPADLDGVYAQLRFGNYVMARLCATLPCRWLSLTTVSSGAILRSSRRCHTDTPSASHAVHAVHVSVGAPRVPIARSRTDVVLLGVRPRGPTSSQHTGRVRRRVVSATAVLIAPSLDGRGNTSRHRSETR